MLFLSNLMIAQSFHWIEDWYFPYGIIHQYKLFHDIYSFTKIIVHLNTAYYINVFHFTHFCWWGSIKSLLSGLTLIFSLPPVPLVWVALMDLLTTMPTWSEDYSICTKPVTSHRGYSGHGNYRVRWMNCSGTQRAVVISRPRHMIPAFSSEWRKVSGGL